MADVRRVARPLLAALPLLPAAVLLAALLATVANDPTPGFTYSASPFTDEAYNVLNARNLVVLGRWATDQWDRVLVSLPFVLAHAATYAAMGVGIVQARLVSIVCAVLAVLAIGVVLSRELGRTAGVIAAAALAGSTLFLYYGRLALLEPMVALWLTVALLLVLARPERATAAGIAAGLAWALAIGTKPNAAFAVAGAVAGIGLAGWPLRPPVRRWLLAAVGTVAAAGVAWILLAWLPNRVEISRVLQSWPAESLPGSLREAYHRVHDFLLSSDGVLPDTAPLIAGSALSVGVCLVRWRSLDGHRRMLFGGALGWLVVGTAVLLLVTYRPNRYFVPLLPAAAILVGLGWAESAAWLGSRLGGSTNRASRAVGGLAAIAVLAALVLPGGQAFTDWNGSATHRLPAIQAQAIDEVPRGAAVEGWVAPLIFMRAPVETILSNAAWDLNTGDLYRDAGVRWVLAASGVAPLWAPLHPATWAARVEVACWTWGGAPQCLYRLPGP